MKIFKYPEQKQWKKIARRPLHKAAKIEKQVRKILDRVRSKGDKALLRYAKQFDEVDISSLEVTPQEISAAHQSVSGELQSAILQAKKNIESFHLSQQENISRIETMPGVSCWRRSVAIEKVGLYIPGGTAPLFSTVLMLAIPARIAGCSEIILVTPVKKGSNTIDPAILFTASLCGIEKIFKSGGAQAIAALAYGTETIPPVQKIFGPGNQYVTIAKQLIQQEGLAIDMPAGPSEMLVIADETADPEFIAADLLSQAEHGPDSQVLLLTNDEFLLDKVGAQLESQLNKLPRKAIAIKALENSRMIVLRNIEDCLAFSNLYAPEHLILAVKDPLLLENKISSAGSVFLGHYSPESVGDYASGTNHTLPTNGFAAMYSGVSLDSFVKKISFQQLTTGGLRNIARIVEVMAEAEGLQAHKNAVTVRLNKL